MPDPLHLAGRRVLVTGASGLLGFALTRELQEAGARVCGVWSTHPVSGACAESIRCDLRDREAVAEILVQTTPEVVVHAAALTDVGLCESDPALADAVNVQATRHLAMEAARAGAALVCVSSDAVYGDAAQPHHEDDACQPLSVYARTKLAGEEAALRHAPGALVLRTTIVGTAPGDTKSLVAWLLRSFREGREVCGFQDVDFSPLFTTDFSRLLIAAVRLRLAGIWNLGASDACSKFHFARRLAEALDFDPHLVQPGKLADAALRGPRCFQSALDSRRIATALGHALPSVDEGVESFAAAFRDEAVPAAAI